MPKSRRRTTKKTRNIARFRTQLMAHAPAHVVQRQVGDLFPWLSHLPEDERTVAIAELSHHTVAAAGGDPGATRDLQLSIDYWQHLADEAGQSPARDGDSSLDSHGSSVPDQPPGDIAPPH